MCGVLSRIISKFRVGTFRSGFLLEKQREKVILRNLIVLNLSPAVKGIAGQRDVQSDLRLPKGPGKIIVGDMAPLLKLKKACATVKRFESVVPGAALLYLSTHCFEAASIRACSNFRARRPRCSARDQFLQASPINRWK